MITRKEIIMAMGAGDMSNKTLYNEMAKYVPISLVEVDDIIRCGVDNTLRPLVAYILNIKAHIPKGFTPTIKPQPAIRKRFVQMSLDIVPNPKDATGKPKEKIVRKKNSSVPWTNKEIEKAIALRNDGKIYKDIGNELHRTRDSVTSMFRRMGKAKKTKKKPVWTDVEVNNLIIMKSRGFRYKSIASQLERSVDAIQSKVAELRAVGLIDGI